MQTVLMLHLKTWKVTEITMDTGF